MRKDYTFARDKNKSVGEYGKPIRKPSNIPILESRQYKVEYADGNTEIMAVNIISETSWRK